VQQAGSQGFSEFWVDPMNPTKAASHGIRNASSSKFGELKAAFASLNELLW